MAQSAIEAAQPVTGSIQSDYGIAVANGLLGTFVAGYLFSLEAFPDVKTVLFAAVCLFYLGSAFASAFVNARILDEEER